jgi:molybdopterin converting factor small subunit
MNTIHISIPGSMRANFKKDLMDFELDGSASYGKLLEHIDSRFGDMLGAEIWNRSKNTFLVPIIATNCGRVIKSATTPLSDGQSVEFIPFLVGG